MTLNDKHLRPLVCTWLLLAGLTLAPMGVHAQDSPRPMADAPIVQPGKPGQPSRLISADEAIRLAGARHSAADVRFMQDMIPHHDQALEMSALVAERTGRNALIDLARRIDASQRDEIRFMQGWLRERGESVPDPTDHHAMHMHHEMAGMATPAQMAELAQARGDDFDRLFLELMIEHHRGALVMVETLLEQPGSAQDTELFDFTTEVSNDQSAEIDRMIVMLAGYSPDPRAGLAAGFRDAGQASMNMELIASLPKPPGFYDPENPAGLPQSRLQSEHTPKAEREDDPEPGHAADRSDGHDKHRAEHHDDGHGNRQNNRPDQDHSDDHPADRARARDQRSDPDEPRQALLDFANTDMAFSGNHLVVGNYHGFKIYDISDNGIPRLVSAVVCPGGQGDVSVVGDLLILSVEQVRGRLDCGLQGVAEPVSEERFRGLRIFDISDVSMPIQVGAVQTCRGSHTHTVVSGPDPDGRLIVYNSGTSVVRDDEELEGCLDESPWRDEQTALFRIDVIEIPVDRPQDSRIIHSPAVFADPESGILAGLWERGDHGPDTQTTNETNHCHDITVFPALNIAAGACSGNGILFDISDPVNPERIHEVVDPGFAYWHSATFNNDGTKLIFTDEWGGGTRPRCRASDPLNWGANAIYDIVDNELVFGSYFKMPAPQTEQENCVAHNGSIVPVPGRDIFVQAWYQGGISLIDFTDTARPVEIGYFDRGPIDEQELLTGGFWSAYWYRGLVYATEIVRGLDVLELSPSEYLSADELAAAARTIETAEFNPQQQFQVAWPAEPIVARAYIDQLERHQQLTDHQVDKLRQLLDQTENAQPDDWNADQSTAPSGETLADRLRSVATELSEAANRAEGMTRKRKQALAGVLAGMAAAGEVQVSAGDFGAGSHVSDIKSVR